MQDDEPVLASHLHSSILVHKNLEDSLAFVLANKLSSPTLLPTNLMRLMVDVYRKEPVRPSCEFPAGSVSMLILVSPPSLCVAPSALPAELSVCR